MGAEVAGPTDQKPGSWAEVRLLGPLRVRLDDGSQVQDRDWRTGKNVDLLRWLALRAGDPVSADTLSDGLWPDTDEARARSSLRTAVAQLRRVLGPERVTRVGDGLALVGCWIDAGAFVQLADEADRHRRAGRNTESLTAALEADALYLGDMTVAEHSPSPIVEDAGTLRSLHRRLLGDAAEAALELGWLRDAADFARRLVELDRLAERGSRVLMLATARLGEVPSALQEYERCRHALAEELGVDPSPQTRAAHAEVLRPPPTSRRAPAFVGRASELAWLGELLEASHRTDDGPSVAVLRGARGVGRRRLVVEACRRGGLALREVRPGQPLGEVLAEGEDQVVLWRADPVADQRALAGLLSGDVDASRARAVLVLLPSAGEIPAVDVLLQDTAGVRSLQLQPLLTDDIALLARHQVGGALLPSCVEELHRLSAGVPGAAIAVLREWSTTGQLVATSQGLAVAPDLTTLDGDRSGRRALARALPQLEGDALEALQLAALLEPAVTPSLLAPLLPDRGTEDPVRRRADATAALEQLVDLALLRSSAAGAVWRHPLLKDAVRAWTRPATALRLHRRIAALAAIPSAERVEHWLRAGERELACVAAIDAAAECSARGDHAGARTHLLAVCSLGDLPEASAEDQADLFESLGDACALLHRPQEAMQAYQQAFDVALGAMLPQVSRLRRKLQAAADPRALEAVPSRAAIHTPVPVGSFGAEGADMSSLPRLEAYLHDSIEQADRRHDHRRAVQTRLQMAAAVCLPRRDFRGVHRWVEAALALDPRPSERLRSVLVRQATPALLGGARTAQAPLDEAARAAEAAGEETLWWRLLGMRVLVAHDLGDAAFAELWPQLERKVMSGAVDDLVPELASIGLRVLAEREELDAAVAMSAHLPLAGGQSGPVLQQLASLGGSELAAALGDTHQAVDLLEAVVDEGRSSGFTLLVPEAAARLVLLQAVRDPQAARKAFDTYDEVVGAAVGGPREEFFRRLSRAAVRAAGGDLDGAAAACAQAGALASQHGLQVLAATARQTRARHLRDAGREGGVRAFGGRPPRAG